NGEDHFLKWNYIISNAIVSILFMSYILFLMISMVRHRLVLIFYLFSAVIEMVIVVFSITRELYLSADLSVEETEGERFLCCVYRSREYFIGKKLDCIINEIGKPNNRKKHVVMWKSGRYAVSAWINKRGKCIDMKINYGYKPSVK
ncbi:hypothetical protein J8V57_07200, partial [Xenorhabdus sp. PB61.4]|uniref:hypothetical protein n=1 Tax=Xenorhabdus sp. PB61.4 TaxID=2788940 RepID=UPI001E2FC440